MTTSKLTGTRQKANRLKVKDLFVLGAGASFAATQPTNKKKNDIPLKQTPLDKDLAEEIQKLNKSLENKKRPGRRIKIAVEQVLRELKIVGDIEDFGLEQAVLVYEANRRMKKHIRKDQKYTTTEMANFLRSLAYVIYHRLYHAKDGYGDPYQTLASKRFNANDNRHKKNRIITFNYDTVLDDILLHSWKKTELLYTDYLKHGEFSSDEHPLMLKLHGSINWHCNRTIFDTIAPPESNQKNPASNQGNSAPRIFLGATQIGIQTGTWPCIMPPIANKPITSLDIFAKQWSYASEYLEECRNLYLCGYSLPLTDPLAESLFRTFKNKNLKEITVVDPDPSVLTRWTDILTREGVGSKNKPPSWRYHTDFNAFVKSL